MVVCLTNKISRFKACSLHHSLDWIGDPDTNTNNMSVKSTDQEWIELMDWIRTEASRVITEQGCKIYFLPRGQI